MKITRIKTTVVSFWVNKKISNITKKKFKKQVVMGMPKTEQILLQKVTIII